MNSQQNMIVKVTWSQVATLGEGAAELFYQRLFSENPEIAELFDECNMADQYASLLASLDPVIGNIDNLEALVPQLEQSGIRHAHYGVKDSHFDSVGNALLWTLEQGQGANWTPQAQQAWADTYQSISTVMRYAMAGVTKANGVKEGR